jgi:hypothetical protein
MPPVFLTIEQYAFLLLSKPEVLLGGDHTNSVGVTHATTPPLHTDNAVTPADDAELDTVGDTPLQTTVDILLPYLDIEVRLLLGKVKGVDTTIQVGILSQSASFT